MCRLTVALLIRTSALILCLDLLGCKLHPERTSNVPEAKPSMGSTPKPDLSALVPKSYTLQSTSEVTDQRVPEMSGLAVSTISPDILWTINDSGNTAVLYALRSNGQIIQSYPTTLVNRDWESLTSYKLQNQPYLMIADSGDNLGVHGSYQLHIFPEPDTTVPPPAGLAPVATHFYRYPDGSHNCEAVAVSEPDGRIILLTKSSKQPGIYSLPLPTSHTSLGSSTNPAIAQRLGKLAALPQSGTDRFLGRLVGVDLSQVTGFEINHSGTAAVVLTYRSLFRWTRPNQTTGWGETLEAAPELIRRHTLTQAEALGLSRVTGDLFITSERIPAPLWRLVPD